MKRLSTIVIAAASILACLTAKAQGGADALPFVRTDFGPALTGTAGAAVANAEAGPWSAFRSAAAMAFPGSLQGAAGEFRMSDGNAGFSAAAMAKLGGKLGLGFGLSYLGGDKIGDYRTNNFLLSTAFAYSITDSFSLGANLRFARQNLMESVSYNGVSLDINALARLGNVATATVGLSALGNTVESASGTAYAQPTNVYAGAEYVYGFDSNKLAVDAMAEYYISGNFGAAVGASFTYDGMVTARAGYRYASQGCVLPSHFSLGLEGRFGGFAVNASFSKMPTFNIFCAGAGFYF